jgi:PII-like signaling protein
MQIPKDAVLLRIFFGENDRFDQRPLYEAVVLSPRTATSRRYRPSTTDGLRSL